MAGLLHDWVAMKTSELIEQLQGKMDRFGDLPIRMYYYEEKKWVTPTTVWALPSFSINIDYDVYDNKREN